MAGFEPKLFATSSLAPAVDGGQGSAPQIGQFQAGVSLSRGAYRRSHVPRTRPHRLIGSTSHTLLGGLQLWLTLAYNWAESLPTETKAFCYSPRGFSTPGFSQSAQRSIRRYWSDRWKDLENHPSVVQLYCVRTIACRMKPPRILLGALFW